MSSYNDIMNTKNVFLNNNQFINIRFQERWNNPEFGKSFTFGFGTGLWWAFVTMTTVG